MPLPRPCQANLPLQGQQTCVEQILVTCCRPAWDSLRTFRHLDSLLPEPCITGAGLRPLWPDWGRVRTHGHNIATLQLLVSTFDCCTELPPPSSSCSWCKLASASLALLGFLSVVGWAREEPVTKHEKSKTAKGNELYQTLKHTIHPLCLKQYGSGSLEKWIIPELGQGKCKMTLKPCAILCNGETPDAFPQRSGTGVFPLNRHRPQGPYAP